MLDIEQRVEFTVGVHHRLKVQPKRIGVDFIRQGRKDQVPLAYGRAACLNEKAGDYPMEPHAVVVSRGCGKSDLFVRLGRLRQSQEIRHVQWRLFGQ